MLESSEKKRPPNLLKLVLCVNLIALVIILFVVTFSLFDFSTVHQEQLFGSWQQLGQLKSDVRLLKQEIDTAETSFSLLTEVPHSTKPAFHTFLAGSQGQQCDHVFENGTERVWFVDNAHLIYGSNQYPTEIPTCRSLLQSLVFNETDTSTRMSHMYKYCLRCHRRRQVIRRLKGPITKHEVDYSMKRLRRLAAIYSKKHRLDATNAPGITKFVKNRSNSTKSRFVRQNKKNFPVITVMLAITSRGMPLNETGFDLNKNYSLLNEGFRAHANYIEPGFEYWFVLVGDEGDLLFDVPANQDIIKRHFQNTVAARAERIGTIAQIQVYMLKNPSQKPGPAFNAGMAATYADGSDYFYRLNDDVYPLTPWATAFIDALSLNKPFNFGVVGPTIESQTNMNDFILTTDFVSKVHFEIFETYYPTLLADWCMDDWISRVYGNHHTCRLRNVKVKHVSLGHGKETRYRVDQLVRCLLDLEYHYGDRAIHRWMKKTNQYFHHGVLKAPLFNPELTIDEIPKPVLGIINPKTGEKK